jgi:multidrug transporter EmrE-like cation transporter
MLSKVLLIFILLNLVEVGGMTALKMSNDSKNKYSFILIIAGVLLYALQALLFKFTFNYMKFGTVNIMHHVAMAISTVALSIFFFKEHYSGKEMIGLVLGVISILLLDHEH